MSDGLLGAFTKMDQGILDQIINAMKLEQGSRESQREKDRAAAAAKAATKDRKGIKGLKGEKGEQKGKGAKKGAPTDQNAWAAAWAKWGAEQASTDSAKRQADPGAENSAEKPQRQK